MEDKAVTLFREYLRLKTVQPNPDYGKHLNSSQLDSCNLILWIKGAAISFLQEIVKDIGLDQKVISPVPDRPILVATWVGSEPSMPSILLNSHTDVVPVYADQWKHDPFEAHKDENGRIYGRGTQDMKCVTIQYLEAIRRLKAEGVVPKRTVHLTFMPGPFTLIWISKNQRTLLASAEFRWRSWRRTRYGGVFEMQRMDWNERGLRTGRRAGQPNGRVYSVLWRTHALVYVSNCIIQHV